MNLEFLKCRSKEFNESKFWLYKRGNFLEIHTTETPNTECLSFSFWKINNYTWEMIEDYCMETFHVNEHEKMLIYNYEKMKLFFFRYLFRSWSFDDAMIFDEEGKLDDTSFEKLMRLHPVILRELSDQIFDYTLSEEDMKVISQQSHFLFAKNQSVSNPHKMISLYCNLTEMWDKFGLNYFDLMKMPLYEKNALKKIVSIENGIRAAEIQQMEAKSKSKNRMPMR